MTRRYQFTTLLFSLGTTLISMHDIDGVVVGKHPIVSGLMKGIFHQQLSHKLVVLPIASRASKIHALDIRYLERNENGATITTAKLTKTLCLSKKKVVHYLPLQQEERLYLIVALEEYLTCIASMQKEDASKAKLLLSVVRNLQTCI